MKHVPADTCTRNATDLHCLSTCTHWVHKYIHCLACISGSLVYRTVWVIKTTGLKFIVGLKVENVFLKFLMLFFVLLQLAIISNSFTQCYTMFFLAKVTVKLQNENFFLNDLYTISNYAIISTPALLVCRTLCHNFYKSRVPCGNAYKVF